MYENDAALAAAEGELRAAGDELQAEYDTMLDVPVGMFSQSTMNALVDAANAALVAGGFEGDYPSFAGDVTEFPVEFVRLLSMLADAAVETGAAVDITLAGIEDDRDVAMLAASLEQLALDPSYTSGMGAPVEEEVVVGDAVPTAPLPAEEEVIDEEALMMERM
jgi:hypothetical protein